MYKNIKSIISKVLLSLALFTSYSYADNIDLVKDSIMRFDKSITVGQAFDNWENCKDKIQRTSCGNGKRYFRRSSLYLYVCGRFSTQGIIEKNDLYQSARTT